MEEATKRSGSNVSGVTELKRKGGDGRTQSFKLEVPLMAGAGTEDGSK